MIEKTIYIANDGMTFETKEECSNHEESVTSVIEAMKIIKNKERDGKYYLYTFDLDKSYHSDNCPPGLLILYALVNSDDIPIERILIDHWGDIHSDKYDVAWIECIEPYILACSIERVWFKWDDEKGGYFEAKAPEVFADWPPPPYYPVSFL